MRKSHRPRVLTVRGQKFFWRTYHRHADGCEEVLWLRRPGAVTGLILVFRPGEERHIPAGGPSAAGVISTRGRWLNLNEPGAVRALLEVALRRGRPTGIAATGPWDGWELFDEAYTELTAARRRDESPGRSRPR